MANIREDMKMKLLDGLDGNLTEFDQIGAEEDDRKIPIVSEDFSASKHCPKFWGRSEH